MTLQAEEEKLGGGEEKWVSCGHNSRCRVKCPRGGFALHSVSKGEGMMPQLQWKHNFNISVVSKEAFHPRHSFRQSAHQPHAAGNLDEFTFIYTLNCHN